MRYCVDTWYFLKLFDKDGRALEIKKSVIEGKDRLIIPTIVITEFLKNLIQRGKKENELDGFINNLTSSEKVNIVFLDELIAKEAAKVSVSYGTPTIDSIIAATCKMNQCDKLLSDDEHMKNLQRKNYLHIEFW